MELGLIRSVDIDNEMQQAYLDYAMSVIVARALPDARDGLKPVHRRILYAMHDMGLRPDSAYKKSARIVGEVLGKYHPHGDMAVYEAMARMAQDFSMRYLLVDGQGNFGSVDGDPPAAMRYTEARLASPAVHMLADIDKNTINFSQNFDGSLTEPDVLPASLPNLLVNGATGIAVGMSTSIPPHNLAEVVDALKYMLDKWAHLDDISVEDLMKFIQGPDFPTGGVILPASQEEGLTAAYGTGRGRVTVQARAHIEEMDRGRNRIIVTELPYMTNKSSLIERIADLVREGRLDGIADLRDESDRRGMRIVIELTKAADPEALLKNLYKNTSMRSTFGVIMLALVDGEPRLLSLKQALRVYLDHRLEVIRRRTEFDLARARNRAHILEGLRVALKNLDAVIELIRRAPDVETARTRLMKRFRLSEIQAQAILDMQLRRLAALERKKIEDEYKEVLAQIKLLEGLLKSPLKMRQVASNELQEVKDAYGDRRRTYIAGAVSGTPGSSMEPSIASFPSQQVWVSITAEGLVSRTVDDSLPLISGVSNPRWILPGNTQDVLYLVTTEGEAAGVPIHALPEASPTNPGTPFYKLSALGEQDNLAEIFTLPSREKRIPGGYVFSATRQGLVKRTTTSELPGATAKKFVLVKVNEGDSLGWVRLTDGKSEIILANSIGNAIKFSEEDVRPMGLVAAGVGGIKLAKNVEVAGMELANKQGELFLVATDGKVKRVKMADFSLQGRNGQGVLAWKLSRNAQLAGMAGGKGPTRITVHLEKSAPKRLRFDDAPLQTRAATGKILITLRPGDRIIGLTTIGEPLEAPKRAEGRSTRKRTSAAKVTKPPTGGKRTSSRQTKAKATESVSAPGRKSTAPKRTSPVSKAQKPPTKDQKTTKTGKITTTRKSEKTAEKKTSRRTKSSATKQTGPGAVSQRPLPMKIPGLKKPKPGVDGNPSGKPKPRAKP